LNVVDANMAVDAGARAIVVFNHDGRVLDNAPVAAGVLPEIADAVKGKVAILVDGVSGPVGIPLTVGPWRRCCYARSTLFRCRRGEAQRKRLLIYPADCRRIDGCDGAHRNGQG